MLYVYDNALVEDLQRSFSNDLENPVVKIISPEEIIAVAAQLQSDEIKLPLISLERDNPVVIDEELYNFSKAKRGLSSVIDEQNRIYFEKLIPVKLSYTLTILTSNQADTDEIIRELIFKYLEMYYLDITIPYESKRKIRFGVCIDNPGGINTESGVSDYLQRGVLYQTHIGLRCEGCVLVTYTPAFLHAKTNLLYYDNNKITENELK